MTSEQECQKQRQDIASLIDHLQDLIQNGCNDWDEAGSLEHVSHLLKEAVAFYSGLSVGEIEETLEEVREGGKC